MIAREESPGWRRDEFGRFMWEGIHREVTVEKSWFSELNE